MRWLRWATPLAFLVVLAIPAAGAADEEELVVVERTGRIVVVRADGSGPTDLGPGSAPAFSPDGARIAFVDGGDVWVAERASGARTRITNTPAVERDPVWSPDGTRLAFARVPSGFAPAELQVASADGTRLLRVAADFVSAYGPPSWSPAGDEVAYTAARGPVGDIAVARADGSGVRRLTADDAEDREAAWSPRGDSIAFLRATADGMRLHLIEADGTRLRQLSPAPAGVPPNWSGPVWSQDGGKLLFFDYTTLGYGRYGPYYRSDLRALELGGGERVLGGALGRPAWSEDGSRILYNTGSQAPGEEAALQTYVMNADGTCRSRVAAGTIGVQPWHRSSAPALRCTDLQLTVTADRNVVGIDQPAAFEIEVTNIGTEPATGVQLDVEEPLNGRLALTAAAAGACSVLLSGSCSLGTLPPGGVTKVAAVVEAHHTGQVRAWARVRSDEPDRNQAGNRALLFFDSLRCTHAGTWSDDVILGTEGNDLICALTGADVIRALGGADTIDAGNGSDRVFPGPGRDSVDLKGGNDFIDARDGRRDVIACGGEIDVVLVDRIDAVGDRCEVVSTTPLRCSTLGTFRADRITGAHRGDSICALSGSDSVDAGAGDDEIDGGTGNDTVTAGPGRDVVLGGGGNDLIRSRDGRRDVVRCGADLDLAFVDRIDAVDRDCERVARR
jgi:Domain of unknown function DUF11/WD40-like Beta Propeller Repeat/RTX calcium-binding nonapeptide repeat (4 copies)